MSHLLGTLSPAVSGREGVCGQDVMCWGGNCWTQPRRQRSQSNLLHAGGPYSPSDPQSQSRGPWAALGSESFGHCCVASRWSRPPCQEADRGPWDPRGSEGQGLICCIVHRYLSSCSGPGPDPVPAPYYPQSLSCTSPSLSSMPVSYQFWSQSQSQSQFQHQSQLNPNPISVLVSGPAQTNSSSTVSPSPSPVQPSTRGGAGTHIRAILVEFPTGKQQRRWTERTAAAPWTARPRKGRRCVRSGAMAPWVLECRDEGWEMGGSPRCCG